MVKIGDSCTCVIESKMHSKIFCTEIISGILQMELAYQEFPLLSSYAKKNLNLYN